MHTLFLLPSPWYDLLEDVADAWRRNGIDVNEALIRAIEVTNDWRYVPGATFIRDRLSPRRDNFLRLRDLCQILNPQPQARWGYHQSIKLIQQQIEGRMFPMTVQGLDDAMRALV